MAATIHVRIAAQRTLHSEANQLLQACIEGLGENSATNPGVMKMYQSISGLMSKLGVSEDTTARSVSSQVMDHGMDPGLDLDAIIRFVDGTNDLHADPTDLSALKVRPISPSWTQMRRSTLATGLKPGPGHKTTFTDFLVLAGTTTTSTITMTRSE